MALIKCKECGSQVSSSARACPSCGHATPKRTSPITWFFGLIMVLAFGGTIFRSNNPSADKQNGAAQTAPAPVTQSPEKTRADKEARTVLAGARALRDAMKKPETFELASAVMIDGATICYEYRARNSFNDRTTERYVVSDTVSSRKAADWKKLCAGRSGTDYSHVRAVL